MMDSEVRFRIINSLAEFNLVQDQIRFVESGDVHLSLTLPNITFPSKTKLMLNSFSSNKCIVSNKNMFSIIGESVALYISYVLLLYLVLLPYTCTSEKTRLYKCF